MSSTPGKSRSALPAALLTAFVLSGLLAASLLRLQIDTDIINSLPDKDPVLADARYVLRHHPFQNQIALDLYLPSDRPERLAAAGDAVEELMLASGLFQQVGIKQYQQLFPELIAATTRNLPMLFSAEDLRRHAAELLTPAAIRRQLEEALAQLGSFEGIGQAGLLDKDPLGLRKIALARLAHSAPVQDTRLYRGHLMSPDRRHLLIVAKPMNSGTDTDFARELESFFRDLSHQVNAEVAVGAPPIKTTPMGAYRAALDNERTAKRDMRWVIAMSTIGIALLLVFTFPRPYMGLLSLLPALAGTVVALFVFSLFHRTVSVLTLAFGGAVISITVDHGITYLLFLDRPYRTQSRDAAKEVWSIGLLAILTTVGAFSILSFSGYAVLTQIGQFAAMGIFFSFLFVHTVFPRLIAGLPPAGSDRSIGIQRFLTRLADWGGWAKAVAAAGLAVLMAFYAKPQFNNDFRAMNTVSPDTRAAEQWVSKHWGSFSDRIFLTVSADDPLSMQQRTDHLLAFIEVQADAGKLQTAFSPSMLFPGPKRGRSNFDAWKAFWHPQRAESVAAALKREALSLGFAAEAFEPFIESIRRPRHHPTPIPESLYPLLGIVRLQTDLPSDPNWLYAAQLTPGPAFDPDHFVQALSRQRLAKVFEPTIFSTRLGQNLADTFQQMVVIIGLSVTLLVFLFFMDWQLAIAALMPVLFAFVMTLGTLNLLGHPVDIPGLMLSIVILGMGIDYTLFLVRARQRYRSARHPSTALVRLAVFLASASTLIGFGTLNFADHRLLQSAGLTCFLGIAYSLIGAYTLLPPMLNRLFPPISAKARFSPIRTTMGATTPKIYRRYRHMAASVRLAVWTKLHVDPLFGRLPPLAAAPRTIVHAGAGRGEITAWLKEAYPLATVIGVEPNHEFRRIAGHALGEDAILVERFDTLSDRHRATAELIVVDDAGRLKPEEQTIAFYKRLEEYLSHDGRLYVRVSTAAPGMARQEQRTSVRRVGHADNVGCAAVERIRSAVLRTGLRIDAVQRCGQDRLIVVRHGVAIDSGMLDKGIWNNGAPE